MNSWDGFDITYSFLDLSSLFRRNKVAGRYWVDIYETATAKPLARIQGSFHNAEPHKFLALFGAAWYGDRYYVLPVGSSNANYDQTLRDLLICDLDALGHEGNPALQERKKK